MVTHTAPNTHTRRSLLLWPAALALLSACRQATTGVRVAPGQTVLAFGDSVTYGTGAGPGEDWPSLLAAKTGWQIVNAGVPGDTAQAARSRLAPLLRAHRPALVIVELGGNDFLRRRAHEAVQEDLRAMLQAARAAGAQAVLVSVPELSLLGALSRRLSDADLYADLAREEKVPLVPDVFSDVLSNPALRADHVHPNAAGYREMAMRLHAALVEQGIAAP